MGSFKVKLVAYFLLLSLLPLAADFWGFSTVASQSEARRVDARLQEPRLPIAFTRFRLPWRFEGREAVIASRATDESGYIQPSREALIEARGTNSGYHYNGIKMWKAHADGTVTNVEV